MNSPLVIKMPNGSAASTCTEALACMIIIATLVYRGDFVIYTVSETSIILTAMSTPEMRLGSPINMALERGRSIIA